MVRLSNNFTLHEMEIGMNPVPAVCVPVFAILCVEILEPVREYAGPLYITSGNRTEANNAYVHGQVSSEHKATADWCAVDFFCNEVSKTFDWMRNNPTLPYHQLILEKGKVGHVIHVSYNRLKPGVRSVLVGATNNSQPYQQVSYVPFRPYPTDIREVTQA